MLIGLVVIGVVVIAILSVIAYRLQKKVNEVETTKAEQERADKAQKQQQSDSMNKSIQILAQGLNGDQLTKTEGSIRISALLEFLQVDEPIKEEFSAFYQLAQATAHIPILDKWKELSTKEKMRYDNERVSLENKFGDFVSDAAQRIIGRNF